MVKKLTIQPKDLRDSEYERYTSAIRQRFEAEAYLGAQNRLLYLMQRMTLLHQRMMNRCWTYERAIENTNHQLQEARNTARWLQNEIDEIESVVSAEGLDDAEFVDDHEYDGYMQQIKQLQDEIDDLNIETLQDLRNSLISEYRNILIDMGKLERKLMGLSLKPYESQEAFTETLKSQSIPQFMEVQEVKTSRVFIYGKAFCIGVAAYAIVGPLCAKAKGLPASSAFSPITSSVGSGIQDGMSDFWNEVLSMAYDQASGDLVMVISEFSSGIRVITQEMINDYIVRFEEKSGWPTDKVQELKEHLQTLSQCSGQTLSELIQVGLEQEAQAPESLRRAWQENALLNDMARVRSVALGVSLGTLGGKLGTLGGGPVGGVVGGAIGTGLGSVAETFCQDMFKNNQRLNQLMASIDPVVSIANQRPVRIGLRTLEGAGIGALLAGPIGAGVGGTIGLTWGANELYINHQGKRLKLNIQKLKTHVENMRAPEETTNEHRKYYQEIDRVVALIEYREDPLHRVDVQKLQRLHEYVKEGPEVTQKTLDLLALAIKRNEDLLELIKRSYQKAIEDKAPKKQRRSILISQETIELLIAKQKNQYDKLKAKLNGDIAVKDYYEHSMIPAFVADIGGLPEKLVAEMLREHQYLYQPEINAQPVDILSQVVREHRQQAESDIERYHNPLATQEAGIYLSQQAIAAQDDLKHFQLHHQELDNNEQRAGLMVEPRSLRRNWNGD